MATATRSQIVEAIRERGPMTVAAFMDLVLYDSEVGYYARAAQRSGRTGDFFTSVDVGSIFGELLAAQLAEMADILGGSFDFVEAGAGNGRLSADLLRALRRHHPSLYSRVRLHLIETSTAARARHRETLDEMVDRLASSSAALPDTFEGVLVANELLDAMPVHQVVMREDGLREVYVDVARPASGSEGRGEEAGALATREGPLSTPALEAYLARLAVRLEPGWRAEISLRAVDWVRNAGRALRRGFLILIDYGHDARELYSAAHAAGTLTTYVRHTMAEPGPSADALPPPWLHQPGDQDITAHVDFTSIRAAAEAEGLQTLGFLDQTYFLLGLLTPENPPQGGNPPNRANPVNLGDLANPENLRRRLALKTLVMPGGLGSTHKVLILGKGIGTPVLRGCSYRVRVT